MALTTDELTYIRRYLRDLETLFTDDNLQDYAEDAEADEPTSYPNAVIALCYLALAQDTVWMVNFRQGETQESSSVIHDRMMDSYRFWWSRAGISSSLPKVGLKAIRLHYIDLPEDDLENV